MKTIKIVALSTIVSLSLLSFTVRSEESQKAPEQKQEAVQSWADWLSGLAEKVKEASNKTAGWVSESAKEAYEKGGEIYQNTSKLYKEYGEPMVEYAAELGSKALAYAKEKGGEAWEPTADYSDKVYAAAADYVKKAYEGAKNLNKVYQKHGATQAALWLKDQVKEQGPGAAEAINEAINDVLKQQLIDARDGAVALYEYAKSQAPALKEEARRLYNLTVGYKEGATQEAQYYKVNEPKIQKLAADLADKLSKSSSEAAKNLAQSAKNIMDVSRQKIGELFTVVQKPDVQNIIAQAPQKGNVEQQIIDEAHAKPATISVKVIKKTDKKAQEGVQQVPAEAQKQ